MKSFKEFLLETPWLFGSTFHGGEDDGFVEKKSPKFTDSLVAKTNTHRIYKRNYKEPLFNDTAHYVAKDNRGNVHISVIGIDNDNHLKIRSLKRHKNSTLPAHEFYAHLIRSGVNLQSDHEQSKGGMKTWENLYRNNPDIKITRHENIDNIYRTELPVHDDWMQNYEKPSKIPSVFRATKR